MSKRTQPLWNPAPATDRSRLHLFNSLSRRKELFVPLDGNNVTWYSCGPTVYDASHMGHARSYISFDILRRVMVDYFGYNIQFVMNITDIDDKIIKRARQNHLYEKYTKEIATTPLEILLADQKEMLEQFQIISATNSDCDKKIMFDKLLERMNDAIEALKEAVFTEDSIKIAEARNTYLHEAKDPIAEWRDIKFGAQISDNTIFENLPRYFEDEFHNDMDALNILPADVLTRVSEYVPEIILFIQRIINNGFAYAANGSVYFDVHTFDKCDNHYYAKLVPEAYGDSKSLQEGEGDLSVAEERLSEKHSPNDFALWKASKAGEPWWESPWGCGRPGWHIECSAMAAHVLGPKFDIHTGGVDLKFPHHDNELAQSEAAFDDSEWVKYFLHTGHLTIAGCKMSKSLKNFVTIKEALKNHTPCQLRLAFLMHSWKDTIDYSKNTMEMAVQYERFLNEFFLNVKDLTRHILFNEPRHQFDSWRIEDAVLQKKFNQVQNQVHEGLCGNNNIDTRSALEAIRELVSATNIYIRDIKTNRNSLLLHKIAFYITDLLYIFGAIRGPRGGIGFPIGGEFNIIGNIDMEIKVLPYVYAIANFRNQVRDEAKKIKARDILKLCDDLRDNILPNLGVRLEDKDSGKFAVKLVNRESLLKEPEINAKEQQERLKEKESKKLATVESVIAKQNLKKVDPQKMFLAEADKYSAFDEKVSKIILEYC